MSRRKNSPPDSLELLLDTICNTFGGVLFMAILIAMLIQTSSKHAASSPTSISTPELQQTQAQKLRDELVRAIDVREQLLESIRRQRTFVATFSTPEVTSAASDLADLANQKSRLLDDMKRHLDELIRLREMSADLERQMQQLEIDLAAAERRRESVRSKLEEQIAKRTQTIRLPKLRPSGKREVGLICRYGRLYVWEHYDEFGRRDGINVEDMIVVDEQNGAIEVAPNPAAGVLVSDRAAILRRLGSFKAHSDYIAIIVYADSFDSFRELKKAFVDAGFEYRLMPIPSGGKITDRGGVGGIVQ